MLLYRCWLFFFFNDTATTEIYTLSLHDALPILWHRLFRAAQYGPIARRLDQAAAEDRKSTRLNSSHIKISYAVFCLKKKKKRYSLEQSYCGYNSVVFGLDILFNSPLDICYDRFFF